MGIWDAITGAADDVADSVGGAVSSGARAVVDGGMSAVSAGVHGAAGIVPGGLSVSKGVECYAFVGDDVARPEVTFSVDGAPTVLGPGLGSFSAQVRPDARLIGTDYVGELGWRVRLGDTEVGRTNRVDSLTGNLAAGSEMTDMLSMPPIRADGHIVDYGFYDAGSGGSGLTDHDQAWVYVTRDLSDWMLDLASETHAEDQLLRTFVLPGAHDAGMSSMASFDEISRTSLASFGAVLMRQASVGAAADAALDVVTGLDVAEARRAIEYLALTQKDSVADMLALGCRYFDFRPGHMHSAISGHPGLYHQHMMVPGLAYDAFLRELTEWLGDHAGEVVVIGLSTDGFAEKDMIPSRQELDDVWNALGTSIGRGGPEALDMSYGELVGSGTRIVFLDKETGDDRQNDADDSARAYDSYKESEYFTYTPDTIIRQLATLTAAGQVEHPYTILQLQGTCIGRGMADPIRHVTESGTAAPLMSTKARFDAATLPWVRDHGSATLTADTLVVLLNDFVDNATASVAIDWSRKRLRAG